MTIVIISKLNIYFRNSFCCWSNIVWVRIQPNLTLLKMALSRHIWCVDVLLLYLWLSYGHILWYEKRLSSLKSTTKTCHLHNIMAKYTLVCIQMLLLFHLTVYPLYVGCQPFLLLLGREELGHITCQVHPIFDTHCPSTTSYMPRLLRIQCVEMSEAETCCTHIHRYSLM